MVFPVSPLKTWSRRENKLTGVSSAFRRFPQLDRRRFKLYSLRPGLPLAGIRNLERQPCARRPRGQAKPGNGR